MGRVDPDAPPIVQGIQTVGVGRHGSQSMSPELANAIRDQILTGDVHPVAEGAFWGALIMKGVSDAERSLADALPAGALDDPGALAQHLCGEIPDAPRALCAELLHAHTLSREDAYTLGGFLFGDDPGERARGLAASILRVRYETADEYEGLLTAMSDSVDAPFRQPVPAGPPIAQLAEPFDGTLRSYLLTPLLARALQQRGFRALSMVGRSAGPKDGMTLRDLHLALGGTFARENAALSGDAPTFGWAIDQSDLSPALDRWVERRHAAKKRPFLATLEKFLNPAQASLLITSAFHAPYTEKMTSVAERAGFPAAIVMRRGIEGTLSPNAAKPVELLCTVRQADGTYLRRNFEWQPEDLVPGDAMREANVKDPSPAENAALVTAHVETGSSGDPVFDRRVALSTALLDRCLGAINDLTP